MLKRLQKKGQKGMNKTLNQLLVGIVVVFAIVYVGGDIFDEVSKFGENETTTDNGTVVETEEKYQDVPAWIGALFMVLIGMGFVFYVWRTWKN